MAMLQTLSVGGGGQQCVVFLLEPELLSGGAADTARMGAALMSCMSLKVLELEGMIHFSV